MMKSKNETEIFGKNIVYLRKSNNLSKRKMAEILGIGVKSLEKLENEILPPRLSAEIVFNIYDKFGVLPKDQFIPLYEEDNKL